MQNPLRKFLWVCYYQTYEQSNYFHCNYLTIYCIILVSFAKERL